ncbi:hypothetical protein RFI_10442 [Reticulomyxa filosa]|uniref:Uncharacterized protein n=1 Tax=Reticulomyxa filosa TaxID=46433 RepID=X6NL14_RETFI|nr:hypothetical protein RFI_10442 [Reticulomyxa filosa]|eukprot:ETO26691.1 hypothetical protein RFI_10442 [Reticulomyxa filosa]
MANVYQATTTVKMFTHYICFPFFSPTKKEHSKKNLCAIDQRTCDAKAQSQTVTSYIDPSTGVDFTIETELLGPTSVIYIKLLRNQNGQGFVASGNATFGSEQSTHSTLYFSYNSYDEIWVNDPENSDYFTTAAYINVTGGSGAFDKAFGLMTFVAYDDRGNGDWNPYVFANLVLPN